MAVKERGNSNHLGHTEDALREELLQRGCPINMIIIKGKITRRITAYLDEENQLCLRDPDFKHYGETKEEYLSLSAHRANVFDESTSNTYDRYFDMDTGHSMRKVLGLPPGAP